MTTFRQPVHVPTQFANDIAALVRHGRVLFTNEELPADHQDRESVADILSEMGFRVMVNRFGTGNARHSGVVSGCGVGSLTVHRQ